jgi:hypothetical protein
VFSSCWFVYGLRKVFLGKEIFILSGKNLTCSMSSKEIPFLISGIHFTYKFVIQDLKENKIYIFWNFWNIGLVLVTLINWLLKAKCMLTKKQLYENMIWFFIFEKLGRMHDENKTLFFCFINFSMFRRKPSILILDFYLYGIKIQTDINQNG